MNGNLDYLDQEKDRLRREMRAKKRAMSGEEISRLSAVLVAKLMETEEYRKAKKLFIYLSCNQEVRVERVLGPAVCSGKVVAAPRTDGGVMRFFRLESLEGLEKGPMGIRQPRLTAPEADAEMIEVE